MLRNLDPKKPSEPKAKKTSKEEKQQEDFWSRLDYFESESDIPLKFAQCINGVEQVKITSNDSNV